MKVEIEGIDEVTRKLRKKSDNTPKIIASWLNEHAKRALKRVKLRTPTGDTGDLKRGWTRLPLKTDGNTYSIEIINNVEYARHVEYGHRIVDRNRNVHGVVPGVFMATTTEEIARQEMESDKKNLAKRISEGQ